MPCLNSSLKYVRRQIGNGPRTWPAGTEKVAEMSAKRHDPPRCGLRAHPTVSARPAPASAERLLDHVGDAA
jgi:hypothetical protein